MTPADVATGMNYGDLASSSRLFLSVSMYHKK